MQRVTSFDGTSLLGDKQEKILLNGGINSKQPTVQYVEYQNTNCTPHSAGEQTDDEYSPML